MRASELRSWLSSEGADESPLVIVTAGLTTGAPSRLIPTAVYLAATALEAAPEEWTPESVRHGDGNLLYAACMMHAYA